MSQTARASAIELDNGGTMRVKLPEGERELPLQELPADFLDWIDQGRRHTYDALSGKSTDVCFFAQHLPVLITSSGQDPFPFNGSNKGVGYLPKAERLDEFIRLYREVMEQTRGKPWEESLQARLDTAARFNFDREAVDARCLATLEIFEKSTFRNLHRVPLAALLYTGTAPEYRSYQINCAVEVVGADDPRYEFIALSRKLFEYDAFHITQPQYRYAYIFWVSEFVSKTPHRVARIEPTEVAEGSIPWDAAAEQLLAPIPGMIRGRVRRSIEEYAAERGFARVTPEVAREARRALRC